MGPGLFLKRASGRWVFMFVALSVFWRGKVWGGAGGEKRWRLCSGRWCHRQQFPRRCKRHCQRQQQGGGGEVRIVRTFYCVCAPVLTVQHSSKRHLCAQESPYIRFITCLESFPSTAFKFKTVPEFLFLRKIVECFLSPHLSLSSRWLMVWSPCLCVGFVWSSSTLQIF